MAESHDPVDRTRAAPGEPPGWPDGDVHDPNGTLPAVVTTPPSLAATTQKLARYQLIRPLGAGGMGTVYLGFDETLHRKVAVKVMLREFAADPESRERFLREARAAAAIKHDNVVTIYEVGEDRGTPFLAMEYLRGYSLHQYLKRKRPLTLAQGLRVVREAAEGLAAAHAAGLVHRDIKPANLWLEAPNGRVKILDFGLAKPAAGPDDEPTAAAAGPIRADITSAGVVMGTPAFMAPEQARGEPVDHRADLFSLGCVLYRLCAGRPPFEGPTPEAVMRAVVGTDPPPVWSVNPETPADVAGLVEQLLAKNSADRPASAAEVAKALRAAEKAASARLAVPGGNRGAEARVDVTAAPVGRDDPPLPPTDVVRPAEAAPTPRPRTKKRRAGKGRDHRVSRQRVRLAVGLFLAAGVLLAGALAYRHVRNRPPAPQPTAPQADPGPAFPPQSPPAAAPQTKSEADPPRWEDHPPPKGWPPPPKGWPPPKGPPGKHPPPK